LVAQQAQHQLVAQQAQHQLAAQQAHPAAARAAEQSARRKKRL